MRILEGSYLNARYVSICVWHKDKMTKIIRTKTHENVILSSVNRRGIGEYLKLRVYLPSVGKYLTKDKQYTTLFPCKVSKACFATQAAKSHKANVRMISRKRNFGSTYSALYET